MSNPGYPHQGIFATEAGPVTLTPGMNLTIQQLVAIARGDGKGRYPKVLLGGNWCARCAKSAEYISRTVEATMGKSSDDLAALVRKMRPHLTELDPDQLAQRAMIYGVTTGFGTFKSRSLDSIDAASLMQINILRSHAVGVGPPMPTEVVRAMMLLRLRTFIEGRSGIRPEVVELLCDLLNHRVHPYVPEQGSVGSSGDLCPLSHLSLVLIGEGLAWCNSENKPHAPTPDRPLTAQAAAPAPTSSQAVVDDRPPPLTAMEALRRAGLDSRVFKTLAPKEGIALTNGTSAATAYAALAVYDASVLYGTANVNVSLTLQALCGSTRALDPKVHQWRKHEHQAHAARQILSFLSGQTLADRSGDVQDAYSVRCAPAVHGAALSAIAHTWRTIENEINAVTDNPLIFDASEEGPPCDEYAGCIWDVYAAGNFHGEPVGMVCDYLKIAVAELANISERRVQALLDEHHNRGLPANLWPDRATAGMNSGFMIAQYTAAALVSENKVLSHPASVDSIPTSANVEDHVAMSTIAARHARKVVENTRNVLAVELMAAAAGVELRAAEFKKPVDDTVSTAGRRVLSLVRETVPALRRADRELWPDVASIAGMIYTGSVIRAAIG